MGQDLAQVPQLWRSLVKSTQVLPHTDLPDGQDPQAPALQTSVVLQMVPQVPQLVLSSGSLTHRLLQTDCPAGQGAQVPASQISFALHASPHRPQLARSVWWSMHWPLQTRPAEQVQAPFRHVLPGPHSASKQQVPQVLSGQTRCPVRQAVQEPPLQISVALQVVPQAPQLDGSAWRSAQLFPQLPWPMGQGLQTPAEQTSAD